MSRRLKADVLSPFAMLSLILVVLLGVGLGVALGRDIDFRMKKEAAEIAVASVSTPLEPLLQGHESGVPLTDAEYGALATVVQSIVSDETLRVRVYDEQGTALFSSQANEIERLQPDRKLLNEALGTEIATAVGGPEMRPQGSDSLGPVLDIYAPLGNDETGLPFAVLEVHRDYTKIASNIAEAQKSLYLTLGLGLAALYIVLQVGAWGAMRALTRDHARLAFLYQTGEKVRASLDTQDILTRIARDASLLVQGQHSMVCLLDHESGALVARVSYNHAKGSISLHHSKIDEWGVHRAVATAQTTVLTQGQQRYAALFGEKWEGLPLALLCVPMKLRSRVNGAIIVLKRAGGAAFGRPETQLLEELAGQAAMALEQASLFAKVRAYADELELSYHATLKALTAALDAKDAATEGHSERVAALTVATAREMEVSEDKLVDVERGALLHDVGKIGVPDAILRKPRTLSRREWQTMQKHPLLAGVLVSKVGFLEGALPILMYHHERYDGRGYPFGLARDRIPLEARIFAVVDAYDAMTTDRPYREALPHEEAMEEIIANSGSQFDPSVVEVFQRVVERRLQEKASSDEGELPVEVLPDEEDQVA